MGGATGNLVHFEGALVPEGEAKISVLSPAFVRGPVVYETLRGYWNRDRENLFLFRLCDHLRRLRASMSILRFHEMLSDEEMTTRILEVVRANGFVTDIHFRILIYPLDEDAPGRTSARTGVVIFARPRPRRERANAACQISSWLRRGGEGHPARVKAVGLRMFVKAALGQAKLDGYSDLIVQDDRGKIVEATASNVFIVRHGVLATPAVTEQILEGITRDTILTLAGELGIPHVERAVDRTELYDCEEAFLCSTALDVLPIASVDGIPVGSSGSAQVIERVSGAYLSLVKGNSDTHRDWLTPVY